MTSGAVLPDVSELLASARAATTSPAVRGALDVILAEGAASLFEPRVFVPEQRLFAFDTEPALWVLAEGQIHVERRTADGFCLRPMSAQAGWLLGTMPGADTRPWPPPAAAYARAITRGAAAVLPGTRFAELLRRQSGELAGLFAFLDLTLRVTERIDLQLRAIPGLTKLSAETLADFVHRAEPRRVAHHEVVLAEGDVTDRFYAVLEGSVTARRADSDGRRCAVQAGVGSLVATPAFVEGLRSPETIRAEEGPALLAVFDRDAWRRLLAAHPMARRGLEVLPPRGSFDVVAVQSDAPGAPLPELTRLLAWSLREDFDDRTAIVHLAAPGTPAAAPHDRLGNRQITVRAATAGEVPAALADALGSAQSGAEPPDIFFLHPSAPPGYVDAAAPLLSRVAWLSPNAHTAPPGALRHVPLDRAALLRPVGDERNQLWPTGTVRLRLDFDVLKRWERDGRAFTDAAGNERATIEGVRRWGRGLTERLVGLALGGGGSPGFAHVALIRALEQRADIPIDVVAGTSFGALVGAWYAGVRQCGTEEPARLQTLLDAGRKLNLCLAVGMLDTGPLAHLVDRQFGGLRLADVEMPFFPVSSEVDSGTVFVGRAGSLGRAVQMSGAFPPFFPPVIRGPYARLVDGGFVNNVPASVLRTEGASFVIASNSIGLIEPRKDVRPGLPRLRRVLAALNPVGRVEDAIRAGLMLFHRIGDAQALYADVSYESAFTGIEFWNFNRGQKVIDATQESADAFADRLATAWRVHRRRSSVLHRGVM